MVGQTVLGSWSNRGATKPHPVTSPPKQRSLTESTLGQLLHREPMLLLSRVLLDSHPFKYMLLPKWLNCCGFLKSVRCKAASIVVPGISKINCVAGWWLVEGKLTRSVLFVEKTGPHLVRGEQGFSSAGTFSSTRPLAIEISRVLALFR